jgi:HEAT repeat protein
LFSDPNWTFESAGSIPDSGQWRRKYIASMISAADDPRWVPLLFEAACQFDDDAAWDAIAALHWLGSKEVLDQALTLVNADDPAYRARAADILGQIGIPERSFPDQCFAAVLPLLSDVAQPVAFAAIFSLQHIDRVRAAPHIIPFASHPDDNIRYAAAFAWRG